MLPTYQILLTLREGKKKASDVLRAPSSLTRRRAVRLLSSLKVAGDVAVEHLPEGVSWVTLTEKGEKRLAAKLQKEKVVLPKKKSRIEVKEAALIATYRLLCDSSKPLSTAQIKRKLGGEHSSHHIQDALLELREATLVCVALSPASSHIRYFGLTLPRLPSAPALDRSERRPSDRAVLAFFRKKGDWFPRQGLLDVLSQETGFVRNTVKAAMIRLLAQGLLRVALGNCGNAFVRPTWSASEAISPPFSAAIKDRAVTRRPLLLSLLAERV